MCFLDDHKVLPQARIWSVVRDEHANDQKMVKFSPGKWRMTYGPGERGSVEFNCAEL